MLTSFVLTMALAAPVPVAPPAPVASGPLPRLMEVKASADGKVVVMITRMEKQKVQIGQGNAINPGGAAPAVITREVVVPKVVTVELGEVKDLTITTADGKKVDVAEATKKLKDGGVVIVSADGKPVSPAHLKLFKDDVLVLTSPELAPATPAGFVPVKPLPPLGRPAPGGVLPVQPQVLPANPGGVIQIQIAPGGQPGVIQVIPIQPAPQPAPAPAPEK